MSLLSERVQDYQATVVRRRADQAGAAIGSALAGRLAIVPPGLPWQLPGAIIDAGHPATELDRVEAVVTCAAVAIATTGTVVLDHRRDQGRRAISLLPDRLVCVVRADQIVYGVPEALTRLDPTRPQTWISGPSATSDIELSRIEGVHGPRQLCVIVLEP